MARNRRTYYAPDNNGVTLRPNGSIDVERETAEKAIRAIRRNANDTDDASLLIDILGLTEHDQS